MMKKQNKKTEVYSTTGFKDTLASPVFYPVIVVSLVLGITSIFGFVQNPLKLKSIVTVIQQKVSFSRNDLKNHSPRLSLSQLSPEIKSTDSHLNHTVETTRDLENNFSLKNNSTLNPTLQSDLDSILKLLSFENQSFAYQTPLKMTVQSDYERVVFNYDVTSENFWTDLDTSTLESAAEESDRKQREASIIGIPLQSDYLNEQQPGLNMLDDSIYAISNNLSKI